MARVADREAVGCGFIEKRGKWWSFRWTDEGGQRRREALKVTTKDAARTKAKGLSQSIENQDWTPRAKRRRLRFVDVATDYVDHVRLTAERTGGVDFELSTAKGYASILRRMRPTAPFFDDYIASVTPTAIEDWLNARQDRDGIALSTRNRELSFVKSVFAWAIKARGLNVNSAARVKIIAHEELDPRRRQTRALTVEELEKLLGILQARGGLAYDVALCAADTGLRRGSLRALRWKHVDWNERLLRLPSSKGKKALEVTLTTRLYEHLRATFEKARSKTVNGTVILTVDVEERPMFPSHGDATKPFDNVRKGLKRAAQEAGIGHVHLHMLRHSYCTQSADAGVPAFVLQEQMGHRNLATTQKYYHASRDSRRQATGLLEQARQRATAGT